MPGTVTVACKLPNGIVLHQYEARDVDEPVMGGGYKTVKRFFRIPGAEVTIGGNATPFGQRPKLQIKGGYALTPGVDKDFWDAWFNANKESDLVKNRLVFAMDKHESAERKATEQKSVRSGLEPLRVGDKTDTRVPRRIQKADVTEEKDQA